MKSTPVIPIDTINQNYFFLYNQFNHPPRMSLAKANHQMQPGHPSWMSLAETNYQSQLGHPS